MSRIHTNIEAIRTLGRLGANQAELSLRLERLSTGLRINRGRDDPAGLIASERLRNEIRGIQQATQNSQRTINVLSVAEGAFNEMSALLLEIRDLVVNTANEAAISPDEVAANQLSIDSVLDSIDRISNTTAFADRKLINGSLAYDLSGVTTSQIAHLQVFAARLPDSGTLTITVEVTASAELATLAFNRGAALPLGSGVTIEVSGSLGTEVITFASGSALSAVVAGVNNFTSMTGVTAQLSGTSAVVLNSSRYGSDEFVSVRSIDGNFIAAEGAPAVKDYGVDTGVLINGQQANADGLVATTRTAAADLEMILDSGFATQTATTATFSVTGGGADFQISPFLTGATRVSLGIPTVSTSNLGNSVDGYLSSLKTGGVNDLSSQNFSQIELIVSESINSVATLRGRLGAFQKHVVETNMNSMQIALENVSAAESTLRDADMAEEVSKLTLAQILVQSTMQVLGIANQNPANVLQLLT